MAKKRKFIIYKEQLDLLQEFISKRRLLQANRILASLEELKGGKEKMEGEQEQAEEQADASKEEGSEESAEDKKEE